MLAFYQSYLATVFSGRYSEDKSVVDLNLDIITIYGLPVTWALNKRNRGATYIDSIRINDRNKSKQYPVEKYSVYF